MSKQLQEKPRKLRTPYKFKSAIDLQEKIDEYFGYCKEYNEVPNIMGMAVYLNVSSETLLNYEKNKSGKRPTYARIVKEAKEKIVSYKVQKLYNSRNATGVIFDLKVNHGWQDKQVIEQDLTVKGIEDLLRTKRDIEV